MACRCCGCLCILRLYAILIMSLFPRDHQKAANLTCSAVHVDWSLAKPRTSNLEDDQISCPLVCVLLMFLLSCRIGPSILLVAFKSGCLKLVSTLESSMGMQHSLLQLPGPTSAVAACREVSRIAVASASQVRSSTCSWPLLQKCVASHLECYHRCIIGMPFTSTLFCSPMHPGIWRPHVLREE